MSVVRLCCAIRYLMIAVIFRDVAPSEHHKLLECALKRDAKGAQAMLSTHIMDCVAYTLANAPDHLLGGPSSGRQAPAAGQSRRRNRLRLPWKQFVSA